MTVASRTPEGEPHRCPVCGEAAALEPSYPGGDSCCQRCGQLLWWFRDRYDRLGFETPEQVAFEAPLFNDLGADSLEVVELVMEMEERMGATVSDEEAVGLQTVADVIRYLRRREK